MAAQEEDHRKELEAQEKHKKLFEGLRFFLNREVPREALVISRVSRRFFITTTKRAVFSSFLF